jgi:hypothetical protein
MKRSRNSCLARARTVFATGKTYPASLIGRVPDSIHEEWLRITLSEIFVLRLGKMAKLEIEETAISLRHSTSNDRHQA